MNANSAASGGATTPEHRARIQRGLQLCRGREFEQGYLVLRSVAETPLQGQDLPGLYYSYLGYGMAAFEARYNDGVALCQRAIKMEFYNPENHLNLARTYLLLGAKKRAVNAIRAGLKVDPEYRPLRVMLRDLGVRSNPVLPFLDRSNPLNVLLGKIRHSFKTEPRSARKKTASKKGAARGTGAAKAPRRS